MHANLLMFLYTKKGNVIGSWEGRIIETMYFLWFLVKYKLIVIVAYFEFITTKIKENILAIQNKNPAQSY